MTTLITLFLCLSLLANLIIYACLVVAARAGKSTANHRSELHR
jgi:hypothetical protein